MSKLIVVTGAAGFIAQNLLRRLNSLGFENLLLVDDFTKPEKVTSIGDIKYADKFDRAYFPEWFNQNSDEVEFVFHLGARTDTTEFDFKILESLNLEYSKTIWQCCTQAEIPLVYASSAATYGAGVEGFSDRHTLITSLQPLNPYGLSKQLFDLYVLEQTKTPPAWCGLKFFNVYGPHEEHKGRMASVALHAYRQIRDCGMVKLFRSHRTDFADGEQLRDFIFVEDIVDICLFFFWHFRQDGGSLLSAIYNAGTGRARSFNDLAKAIFSALSLPVKIEYVDIPADIREKYQYYTQAEMQKLNIAGFDQKFTELEEGVKQYIAYLSHSL